MSTPAHLWLEDENGSPIVGSCLMPRRLGSMELKSFSHAVTIPVDLSLGQLTGTRVHRRVVIVKEFDQTTPVLYRAVCEGRSLRKPRSRCTAFWNQALSLSMSISSWKTSKSRRFRRTFPPTA